MIRVSTSWRISAPVVALWLLRSISAQTADRPLSVSPSQLRVIAGERVQIPTTPESFALIRSARTATAMPLDQKPLGQKPPGQNPRRFAVGPNPEAAQILLGVPLTVEPGEYSVELRFANDAGEVHAATVQVTVEPFATPATGSSITPVV